MKEIKIKICGLTDMKNIAEVADLRPDYMGFILYPGSQRYVSPEKAGTITINIPTVIQKVGVLVNEPFENALKIAQSGVFDLLQLHGTESPDYCRKLSNQIRIIKAFPVTDTIPTDLSDFSEFCTMFLFDTAGAKYGGNGKSFNHNILTDCTMEKEFILGGGITPDDSEHLKSISSDKMVAVDLNSRFEASPGIKDIKLLKYFMEKIRENDSRN